jgi:uncharacterized protein (TIGR00251 family)
MPADETVLVLRVKPRAKRAGLLGWHGDAIKIAVRAAPERGRANDEVIGLLAMVLDLPAGALRLETGAASQDKRVRIHGLEPGEVRRRLDAALDAGNERA